jgi:hypothetical protein
VLDRVMTLEAGAIRAHGELASDLQKGESCSGMACFLSRKREQKRVWKRWSNDDTGSRRWRSELWASAVNETERQTKNTLAKAWLQLPAHASSSLSTNLPKTLRRWQGRGFHATVNWTTSMLDHKPSGGATAGTRFLSRSDNARHLASSCSRPWLAPCIGRYKKLRYFPNFIVHS